MDAPLNMFDKSKREKVMSSKNSFKRGKTIKLPKNPEAALERLKRKAGAY
jgi:hypothetical protein